MGLDDTLYGTVQSNLLAQDPLPTLNKVYATLVQEERLRGITRVIEERGEAMAFAVHSNFKHKEKGRLCSHCNQTSDQLQTLASLLNNVKLGSIEKLNGKCSFLPWIIDTDGKTPFELLYGKPHSLEHLRVIGCLAYAHNQHHKGDKFASRSHKFPFAAEIIPQQLACKDDHTLPNVSFNNNIVEDESFQHVVTIPVVPSAPVVETTRLHDRDRLNGMLPVVPIVSHIESSSPESHDTPPAVEINEEPPTTDTVKYLGRGHRVKIPSTKLQDFVTNTISKICPSNCSIAPSRPSNTPYPLSEYVNYTNFSPQHGHFLATVSVAIEPQSFVEAVKDIRWRNAMQLEIEALENNRTWTVETLPPNKKAIGSKWLNENMRPT
ncbi:hypothetical protein KIW84_013375 [Lathyrus oleraceus]|uniref:Uncharacterized protein n=1 Tax=Pisum sativum TaxID=3888 RepID=A0A9D5BJW4_PEA|nr:hypothetical protein KIW84_013375 [Pisum sativum]